MSTTSPSAPGRLLPSRRDPLRLCLILAGAALVAACSGCAVPQPRGEGRCQRIIEPVTRRPYYLYLPKDYVAADEAGRAARRWPLVVTFHGMKPYDIAVYQEREWEQEADRYGYIVVAPVLMAFDFLFGQFPQRTITGAFKSDEEAILAILDHVFQTTRADPNHVLSTGFSSGGYMAHYMLNRHPERFTCLAPRQANFTASVLDSGATVRSINHPVLILSTLNDVGICKRESRDAIKWYESHGYKNLAWVYLNRLGHERTPDLAADFFARVAGVTPSRPATVLVQRQAIDGNATGLALLRGNVNGSSQFTSRERASQSPVAETDRPASPPRPVLQAAAMPKTQAETAEPIAGGASAQTPRRRYRAPTQAARASPVSISVSSAVGFQPLLLVYSAECPSDWQRTADFYWTLNGQRIGSSINGQKTILEPGDYTLELLVVTDEGIEHRASHQIRVLKSIEASATQMP